MKKLLCLCLACLMLLTLGLPCAGAASPASYRDWTNVVQVVVLRDSLVGLRSDGTVVFDGPQDSEYAVARDWAGVSRLEFAEAEALIGYRADGTVLTTLPCDLSSWTNIRQVQYVHWMWAVFGLRYDGTVVAAPVPYMDPEEFDEYLQSWNLDSWENVVALDDDVLQLIGLRDDGTIRILLPYIDDPDNRTNIASFASLPTDVFYAVRSDGSVFVFDDEFISVSDCNLLDPEEWHNITSFYYTGSHDCGGLCIGLRSDGTVAISDPYTFDYHDNTVLEQVRAWTDIAQLGVNFYSLPVGLKADGTLAYVDVDSYGMPIDQDLSDWTELRSVYVYGGEIYGLRVDGTVLTTASYDLSDWTNIVELVGPPSYVSGPIAGLRADGTVVATPFP